MGGGAPIDTCATGGSAARDLQEKRSADYTCGHAEENRITLHNGQFLPFSIYLRIADPLAELEPGS